MLYLVARPTTNGPEGLKPLPSHPITGARPTGCEGGREGVGDGWGGEAGAGEGRGWGWVGG
jgi:hypothetical protein